MASAGPMSMPQMSARGCGLRSVAPWSIPSMRMSEAYSNSPLTLGTPSARKVVIPTSLGRWISRPLADRGLGDDGHAAASTRSQQPPALARDVARDLVDVGRAQLGALHDRAPADEQQVDRARRAEDQRRDGVLDPGVVQAVQAPQRDVGQLAGLQRARARRRGPGSARPRWSPARARRGP